MKPIKLLVGTRRNSRMQRIKGTSVVRFAMLKKLWVESTSRIITFDHFSNKYPNTKFKGDKIQENIGLKQRARVQ